MKALADLLSRPGCGLSFSIIQDATYLVTPLPDFIYGPLPKLFSEHWFSIRGLHASGIFNGERMGLKYPYILTLFGEHLSCPEANLHEAHLAEVLKSTDNALDEAEEVVHFSGESIFIAGPGYHIYGHWIIDFLPKLFILERAGYDLGTCRYLLPADVPNFAIEILLNIGIKQTQIRYFARGSLVTTDLLVIPTTCHNGLRCSSIFRELGQWLRERVKVATGSELTEASNENIYLTRGKSYSNRNLVNRAEVERCILDFGFKVLYPEDLSLIDQWKLFSRADIVAGEYGSAMHSSVFGVGPLAICSLHGPNVHPGFVQTAIGHCLGQPTGYVFGTSGSSESDSYTINLDDFRKCITMLVQRPRFYEHRL